MIHEHLEWRGKGFCGSSIESQFPKYEYPAPVIPICGMYYRYGGSFIGTMTETNRYVKAYREGKVPFVVNQSIWMEGEAKFADIILPACTNFERWDIGEWANASGYGATSSTSATTGVIVLQKKCIEPLGEIEVGLRYLRATRRAVGSGRDLQQGGKTSSTGSSASSTRQTCPRASVGKSSRRRATMWCPTPEDRKPTPALRWFAEGRKRDTPDWGPPPWDTVRRQGLQTTVGKIEFVSLQPQALQASRDVVDPERPVMGPQYIESWEGHHTRSSTTSTRCRSCPRTPASASTPWVTARTVGPTTSRTTGCSRKTAITIGSCA